MLLTQETDYALRILRSLSTESVISVQRLAEQEVQFAEEAESVEETALRKLQYEQLHKALSLLPDDERELIDRLFFQGQTEREAAECMGIYRNAVHKRKNHILKKLKKFFEKN